MERKAKATKNADSAESAASRKLQQKAEKLLSATEKKKCQPEELMKQMQVVIDVNVKPHVLTNVLESEKLNYIFQNAAIPHSVTWKRTLVHHFITASHTLDSTQEVANENQILIIWDSDNVSEKISNQSFISSIDNICSAFPEKKISLIIYDAGKYFSHKKANNGKGRRVSKFQLEENLADVQIRCNCSSMCVENAEDLSMMIYHYSKAIALAPLKGKKDQQLRDMDTYICGDNRDTVKVDKDGYGLSRLWEKQLCTFSQSTLEVSQAIASVYKSPTELMNVSILI